MFKMTVGVDWGSQEHAVHVISSGEAKGNGWMVRHKPDDIERLVSGLRKRGQGEQIGIAVERPDGLLVEALVEAGFAVYHVNPKQVDRFRDRFNVAGAKDDALDARVLAQCLRTDLPLFTRVPALEDWQIELRRLSRLEASLTRQLVRVANKLHAALSRHFPQMLELSTGLTRSKWILNLIEAVPEPSSARTSTREQIALILRRTSLDPDEVIAALGGSEFKVSGGVRRASVLESKLLVAQIRLLKDQQATCQLRMREILAAFEEGAAEGSPEERAWACDLAVLRSMPGVGDKSLAGLLAEAPHLLQNRSYRHLRSFAGVAPVTRRTGKRGKTHPTVRIRRACNGHLRHIVHQMAGNAAMRDPRFKQLYARARSNGHSHPRALRTVGDRLLSVLCGCLRNGTRYDPKHCPPRP